MFRPLPTALVLIALLTLLSAMPARADTRAWLDRDRIAFGETATLNVETDQDGVTAPDWSPLDADFEVSGHTSTRRVEQVNGQTRAQSLFAVALRPRREGVVSIAPLQVHQERTAALTLTVLPAEDTPAQAGADAFIEAELDTDQAWVQQAVGYVLRLYYATSLVSGQLEQPQPEGAALQRIGDDLQYSREIAGRRYRVVERRFLLVPERSGVLEIPPANFRGRGAGGFFDDMFGNAPRSLRATGQSQQLQVRPMPDAAPTPWLPLRGLEARFLEAPQTARTGEALEVVVELRADGATAAQMPQPALRAGDGAQVFAEPPGIQEHFDRGRPQVVLTRRFSILPRQPGRLQMEVEPFEWWDAQAGVARTVALPPLAITVEPGTASGGATSAGGEERWIRVPGVQGEVRPWAVATAGFALLWLVTLIWALHRRPVPNPAGKGGSVVLPTPGGGERAGMRRLKLSLDTGELGDVEQALCALASPPVADLDALRVRLGDPAQVAAIEGLQRARWAGGEPAKARAGVRTAFAKGPRWSGADAAQRPAEPVPPLYPE